MLSRQLAQSIGLRLTAHARALRLRPISASAPVSEGQKPSGTVKWFNVAKGYGFITPLDGGADIFVHQTNIVTDGFRSLAEGESVEFDLSSDTNGRVRAVNVTGPDGANPVGSPRRYPPQQNMMHGEDNWGSGGGRGGY